MSVWFGADLHLGHKNICRYRSEFLSAEEHDERIMDMLNDAVNKRGTYYLLGDIAFTLETIEMLAKLNTHNNIKIILGNHDIEGSRKISDWVNAGFRDIYALLKYKEFWLSHAPIHPDELRGKYNIYGHTHYSKINDPRYRCVSMEQTDFKLISLEQIRGEFNQYKL